MAMSRSTVRPTAHPIHRLALVGAVALLSAAMAGTAGPVAASGGTPKVLLVGTWMGMKGPYSSIQKAVDDASKAN